MSLALALYEAIELYNLQLAIGKNIRDAVTSYLDDSSLEGALGMCSYCDTRGNYRDVFSPGGMLVNRECNVCHNIFYTRSVGLHEKIS